MNPREPQLWVRLREPEDDAPGPGDPLTPTERLRQDAAKREPARPGARFTHAPSRWDAPPADYTVPLARASATRAAPAAPLARRASVPAHRLAAAAVATVLVTVAIVAVAARGGPRTATFALPGRATGLAVAGGRVWVAAPATGAVWVLDAGSGRSGGPPVRTGGTPARLALGADGPWVADTQHATVAHGAAAQPAGPDVADLALSDGTVWVASAADATVRALPAPGRPGTIVRAGVPRPLALAADARRVVVAGAGGALGRIDARSRRPLGPPVRLGGTLVAVALAGDSAWVADAAHRTVRRVDVAAGRPVGAAVEVGGVPVAVAAGGEDVYVLSRGGLVRIDAATGRIRSRLPAGADPSALALDRDHVWVATGRELRRIDR